MLIISLLIFWTDSLIAQCVPTTVTNINTTLGATNDVLLTWKINCPSSCNNSQTTSILYYVGFYSQQSIAPNGLSKEYGFTTFVAPNCNFTQLWDGDSLGADAKVSICYSFLLGQDKFQTIPGFDASFSGQDICNNLYGLGPGVMGLILDSTLFCPGVTYDIKIWEIEVNVAPNDTITAEDIACLNLYLDESNPAVKLSAFTFPGSISPIAPPQIHVKGIAAGDSTYIGTHNKVYVTCADTIEFDYTVTPGCNFTDQVAAYFKIDTANTYGGGATKPSAWGLNLDDWYIFFANNLVDQFGQPIPFIGFNDFVSFTVEENIEICIMTQDPCNGSSSITCIQFVNVDSIANDASFQYSMVENCDSLVVTFSNGSTGGTSYEWDFGNGMMSTLANPVAVYDTSGTYVVQMVVKDTSICRPQDTAWVTIQWYPPVPDAHAEFNYTSNGCDTLQVDFTNLSTGGISNFWDFGNGLTSTSTNPTAYYTIYGSYQVMLVVVDTGECQVNDTAYTTIVFDSVKPAIADFSFVVNGDTVDFTNLSLEATTYSWDFGDGNNSSLKDPKHIYAANNTYTVTLIASNGCYSDTIKYTVLINTGLDDFFPGVPTINLFPNPTSGMVTLTILQVQGGVEIGLFNVLGENLLSSTEDLRVAQWEKVYDLSGLPTGFYFFRIKGDNLNRAIKIVVK